MTMSIPPVSTPAATQPTNSEPLLRHITPRIQDSLSPHRESIRPAPSANTLRSPLAIVCDFLDCIKYFIFSALHKIQGFFCPCLSKTPHSALPAPPHVIPPPTSRTPPPLPDVAAESIPSRSSITHAEEAEDLAFRTLPLSEADKANIRYIVNTLARVIALPAAELKRRGDEIRHVHPFIFWKYVLTQESLVEDMKAIKTRYFGIIWGQFTGGCIEKLQEMDDASLLAPHVNAFARSIRRDPQDLRDLMGASWMGFLNSLIDLSSQALAPSPRGVNSRRPDRDSDSVTITESLSTADHPAASTDLITTARLEGSQGTVRFLSPVSTFAVRTLPQETITSIPIQILPQERITSIPIRTSAQKTIASIPMTSVQKQKLTRLLTDISQNSSLALGFQVAFLRNDWLSLQDVHPLRLLWEVFSHPAHTAKLDLIVKSSLKKGYFLDDFARTLKAGATKVELRSYFQDFTTGMGIPEDSLERLTAGGFYEWRHLIKYLHGIKTAAAVETTFSG